MYERSDWVFVFIFLIMESRTSFWASTKIHTHIHTHTERSSKQAS